LASGIFPTSMPIGTVTPTVKNTHIGIIVGSVLGSLVAILLGVTGCYCL
jgi:tetrahydromethanopterin S-methyltransferase subunit B